MNEQREATQEMKSKSLGLGNGKWDIYVNYLPSTWETQFLHPFRRWTSTSVQWRSDDHQAVGLLGRESSQNAVHISDHSRSAIFA